MSFNDAGGDPEDDTEGDAEGEGDAKGHPEDEAWDDAEGEDAKDTTQRDQSRGLCRRRPQRPTSTQKPTPTP